MKKKPWPNPFVVMLTSMVLGFALLCSWLYLVGSNGQRLRAAHKKLAVGMTVEQVKNVMEDNSPLRFDGPRDTRFLTSDEADRCIYTLTFTNPYYLDPSIDCYIDANDKLVATHRFE